MAVQFPSFSTTPQVRKIVGRVLNRPAHELTATTDIGQPNPLILVALYYELDAHFGTSLVDAVAELEEALECDENETLTATGRKKLMELLPGVDVPKGVRLPDSFLDQLGVVEALVERDKREQPSTARIPPLFRLDVGLFWTAEASQPLFQLQRELGEKTSRMVLAECCRIANVPGTSGAPLAGQCIDAINNFARTGKGKTELKELARDIKESGSLETTQLFVTLANGLRPNIPDNLLVSAAAALAVAENLDQQLAVQRVISIAAAVVKEPEATGNRTAPAKQVKKKSLLSRLPKSSQREFLEILQRHNQRTLKEEIGYEWNFEQQLTPAAYQSWLADLERSKETHPPEHLITRRRFTAAHRNLAKLAVTRRFCYENPHEALIGLSLAGRMGWTLEGQTSQCYGEPLLGALAAGDLAVVQRYIDTYPDGDPTTPLKFNFRSHGIVAVLRRDYSLLQMAIERDREKAPWHGAMMDFFRGIVANDATQTSTGLQHFIDEMKRLRQKATIEFAININAHAFYRLAESVSPELIAGFDIEQDFPWDHEFHQCVTRGERPWEAVDLSDIAPELQHAVTTLSKPTWWT